MATSALIQIFIAFTAIGQKHPTLVYIKAGVMFFPVAGSQWTLFSVSLLKPQLRSDNHRKS